MSEVKLDIVEMYNIMAEAITKAQEKTQFPIRIETDHINKKDVIDIVYIKDDLDNIILEAFKIVKNPFASNYICRYESSDVSNIKNKILKTLESQSYLDLRKNIEK